MITEALEAIIHVMGQENAALQAHQNQYGMIDKFYGTGKFQRKNLPTFKEIYDPEGAQAWLIFFRVLACTDEQKVLIGTHMLSEEAEYLWEDTCQRLEDADTTFTWDNFMIEFLDKYFPTYDCIKKEIEFLQLKQHCMTVADYEAKFEELVIFCPLYNGAKADGSKCVKF